MEAEARRGDSVIVDLELSSKLARFQRERQEDEVARFGSVLKFVVCCICLAVLAVIVAVASSVLELVMVNAVAHSFFFAGFAVSLGTICICPTELICFDGFLASRPCLRRGVAVVLTALATAICVMSPHFHGLFMLPGSLTLGLSSVIGFRPSTGIFLFLLGNLLTFGAQELYLFFHADFALQHLLPALVDIGMAAATLWDPVRLRGEWSDDLATRSVCKCMTLMMLAFGVNSGISFGFAWAISGAVQAETAALVVGAVTYLSSVGLVAITDRERLYCFVSSRLAFGRAQRERDGAFVVSMLESFRPKVGDTWWVHRTAQEKDRAFPAADCRHHWRQGVILQVSETHFEVSVDQRGTRRFASSTPGASEVMAVVPHSSAFQVPVALRAPQLNDRVSPASGRDVCFGGWCLQPGDEARVCHVGAAGVRLCAGAAATELLPLGVFQRSDLCFLGLSSGQDLLLLAKASIRVLPFSSMFRELFESSGHLRDASGAMLTAGNAGVAELTRPLEAGEQLDLFISHSWNDPGEEKWSVLASVAQSFKATVRREPTFWLDKTCIDQSRIDAGLRLLPVIVMSCKQMLVLWGKTYPSRLWCIWEIFTSLAFSSLAAVAERLLLRPLDGSMGIADLGQQLINFDVRGASCYNPNDERRLRSVIAAVGTDNFNSRVRALGAQLATAHSLRLGWGVPRTMSNPGHSGTVWEDDPTWTETDTPAADDVSSPRGVILEVLDDPSSVTSRG